MTTTKLIIGVVLFALFTCIGCGFSPPDPLVIDSNGEVRDTVSMLEIDEAGIPGCNDLENITSDEDVVFIPVTSEEDNPVLIAIGGQALCIEEEGDDSDDDDLPDVDVDDEVGPEDDTALSLADMGDDDRTDYGTTLIGSGTRGQPSAPPPTVIADPTPEPAGD